MRNKRTNSNHITQTSSNITAKQRGIFFGVIVLFLLLPILVYQIGRHQYIKSRALGCNDSNCQNIKNGDYWMITNCEVPNDYDGDQQLCNAKGRIGLCRNNQYCCPDAGAEWTTNMTACALPSATPQSSNTPKPSNTPVHTSTMKPSSTSIPTSTNRPTSTPTRVPTKRPTTTPTKTPTPKLSGTVTPTVGISETPAETPYSAGGLFVTPVATLTPTPNPLANPPSLTIDPFFDSKNQTNKTFTITGTSDPLSDIDISISPKGPTFTTTADENGQWRYIITKSLSTGKKELIVTARTSAGGQTVVKQSFTVKGASPLRTIGIIVVILGLGLVFYLLYKKQQDEQMSLPPMGEPPSSDSSKPLE